MPFFIRNNLKSSICLRLITQKNKFDVSLIIFKSKTKIDCGEMKVFALKVLRFNLLLVNCNLLIKLRPNQ